MNNSDISEHIQDLIKDIADKDSSVESDQLIVTRLDRINNYIKDIDLDLRVKLLEDSLQELISYSVCNLGTENLEFIPGVDARPSTMSYFERRNHKVWVLFDNARMLLKYIKRDNPTIISNNYEIFLDEAYLDMWCVRPVCDGVYEGIHPPFHFKKEEDARKFLELIEKAK